VFEEVKERRKPKMNEQNDEPIKLIDDLEAEFGVKKEAIDRSKSFYETFDIGALENNQTVKFKILSDRVRVFDFLDKTTKESKQGRTIEVKNLDDGKLYTLWLSAESLKSGLAAIVKENNSVLKNLFIQITKVKVKTEKVVDGKKIGSMNIYRVVRLRAEGLED